MSHEMAEVIYEPVSHQQWPLPESEEFVSNERSTGRALLPMLVDLTWSVS